MDTAWYLCGTAGCQMYSFFSYCNHHRSPKPFLQHKRSHETERNGKRSPERKRSDGGNRTSRSCLGDVFFPKLIRS